MNDLKKNQDSLKCRFKQIEKLEETIGINIITYETECEEFLETKIYMFEHMKYCPYCGRWIKEVKA